MRIRYWSSDVCSSDLSQCSSFLDNGECTLDAETCTDSTPQTRIVDGVEVTQSCWAWQRSYSCARRTAGNDCSALEANGRCRFLREDCLTDDTPCPTSESVYECPLPAGDSGGTQYVCDGDVYCIAGSSAEEHTSELQSLMRMSYAVYYLKKNTQTN